MALELQSEILIPVPPEAVWRVLTAFGRYHEWNDFVVDVEGRCERGAKITVVMEVGLGEPNRLKATLTDVVPPETLAWRSKFLLGSFVNTEHYFELYRGGTHTLLLQGMRSGGLLPSLINNPLEATYRLRMHEMNEALRRTAVAHYRGLV